jgi:TolB-like protein/Flp pilus assembly protein TadD
MIRSGKGEAYVPLLEALTRSCDGSEGAGVVAALQQHAPMWLLQLPGLVEPDQVELLQRRIYGATPERMTRELCNAIEGLANETPVVLVLEDLHWGDVATVDLLATLAQRTEPARLLVLGTYRPADAVLYAKHLRDIVRDLRARGLCEELLLELLSYEDVTNYLGGRLGGKVSDSFALEVFKRTNGNPLFMVNLIEGLVQQQLLLYQDGRWGSDDNAQSLVDAVPETLRALISRRLETLSSEERLLLDSASVVGIEFSVDDVAAVQKRPLEEIDTLCKSLASRGQFIDMAGAEKRADNTICDRYQFHHPLYYDVLYEEVGEAQREKLYRRIAERNEKSGIGQAPDVTTKDLLEERRRTDSQPDRKALPNSVAVLPFENLSPDPDHAFFAAGIHEAILNELLKVKKLNVMTRASVLRYADEHTPVSQIATDLNVQTVMKGSVQYAGDRVRITVQLFEADSATPLWSGVYDQEFKDIFSIQADIANQIALALRAELTPRERISLTDKPTHSFEAYADYLKAIAVGALAGGLETTPEQSATIHQSLDQALTLDSDFALAYALKARDYAYSMARLVRRSDELTVTTRDELALENAARALALDANCGLAHAALGVAHRFAWRDEEAQLAFNNALDLNPHDPRVLRDVAFFHLFRGRYNTAFEVAREIVEFEPLIGNFLSGWTFMQLSKYEDALSACQNVLSQRPDFALAHQLHGFVMLSRGDKVNALETLRLSEELGYESSTYAIAQTGFAYQVLGSRKDALRIFEKIEILAREYIVTDAAWALAYLAVEDQEKALLSLSRAADQRSAGEDISAATIVTNLFSAPVLEQPEFLELRRRLGFAG